ncbi:hypothetical protein SLNWT_5535 [Streptomyces albus]|uniref:Uncharacterized protein n=1 Tax=Streptomyces albus (strain ATCC 21838 / DSM 41398 / FERM P-419 / JCM 4703 / NBRC 107858) TaxID=1081613 RepID=A0A0B5F4W2_STRA4|nr:hypothetical protein SLNWT_5535 [Streptomyces albus]AOU80214.1 hypothetical protein SLNHY_5523 [Streptomyces albus]AYN35929.1 hypothetical protein DUI70_5434 [Streptomyces albus]
MTACALETATGGPDSAARHPQCSIAADGSYAARLATDGESFYPERWTLGGPEPYAVPLPSARTEEPGAAVQPLADGRVLIHRPEAESHAFALLYPTGPGTGELPLGTVESAGLTLLPPTPQGHAAYALAVRAESTDLWLVAGGTRGPELVAEVPGRCSGGVWLDRAGRMLALDRESGGRTKTVTVDLQRGGEVSPFLQLTEESNDRLLLADLDSGLLLLCSDAPSPGRERLGWGVLGSTLPVRFPACLRVPECTVTPIAVQPGQTLMPETAAVALRIEGPPASRLGLWRPLDRTLHQLAPPQGWLTGAGLWTAEGVLRLPYVTDAVPCGVARVPAPPWPARAELPGPGVGAGRATGAAERQAPPPPDGDGPPAGGGRNGNKSPARPVPLREAPLGPKETAR